MLGNAAKIVRNPLEVDSRLKALGLDVQTVRTIAQKAAAARNEATDIDPVTTPGTLAYIYGVRAIREELLPGGAWQIDRTENIEATYNPSTGKKIVYQNVDVACSANDPQPISGKGEGAKRLVGTQSYLFPYMEKEEEAKANTEVWFLCVSFHEEEFRVELSCPSSIEGKQFGEFAERIHVVTKDCWSNDSVMLDQDDVVDEVNIDFDISRKSKS
ncbi:MAG: hypothetical protein ACFHHU_11285 [Porticoccaceae bacterium]